MFVEASFHASCLRGWLHDDFVNSLHQEQCPVRAKPEVRPKLHCCVDQNTTT